MNHDTAEYGTDSLLPTRQSLLSRLRDWQDEEGWREFFESYWRLIYNVARRADLSDIEAQEVVQNTFIYLSRKMPKFHYDRSHGSFKSWLRVVTRSRINVYCRTEKTGEKLVRQPLGAEADEALESAENLAAAGGETLDEVWQREWEQNLVSTAFRRLRRKVSTQQLLIFRTALFGELPISQVAKKLGVSVAQVYLARHRVGRLFKAEIKRLRAETE
jgi:RNA polymerase sigma-70 factor (ECF subfamily)